ncbi:MAG: hypothetical protein E7175_04230 [Erysipelotrichaceae bacterium]|nr:hypothetical protein [Erysipelotrichaceae bacterium]
MLNLITVTGLLFSTYVSNSFTTFSSHFTNSTNLTTFANYYSENGIVTRVDDPTDMKVGTFGNKNYSAVIRLYLPNLDYQKIGSASLELFKQSGYSGTIKIAYKYGFDWSGSGLNNGWNYYTNLSFQGNSFYASVKSIVEDLCQTSYYQSVFFKLYYENSNYSTVFGNNSSSSYRPKINITYNDVPTYNHYGNATTYYSGSNMQFYNETNCYGYAINAYNNNNNVLGLFYGITETYTNENINTIFIPRLINHSKNIFNVNVREINSYNAPIFPFERRIAFRAVIGGNYGSYHFIKEHSDGSWSGKDGEGNFPGTYISSIQSYNWENYMYNSDVHYFAVSSLGDIPQYYVF